MKIIFLLPLSRAGKVYTLLISRTRKGDRKESSCFWGKIKLILKWNQVKKGGETRRKTKRGKMCKCANVQHGFFLTHAHTYLLCASNMSQALLHARPTLPLQATNPEINRVVAHSEPVNNLQHPPCGWSFQTGGRKNDTRSEPEYLESSDVGRKEKMYMACRQIGNRNDGQLTSSQQRLCLSGTSTPQLCDFHLIILRACVWEKICAAHLHICRQATEKSTDALAFPT